VSESAVSAKWELVLARNRRSPKRPSEPHRPPPERGGVRERCGAFRLRLLRGLIRFHVAMD